MSIMLVYDFPVCRSESFAEDGSPVRDLLWPVEVQSVGVEVMGRTGPGDETRSNVFEDLVLDLLKAHGDLRPSVKRMADESGLDEHFVSLVLARLEDKGLPDSEHSVRRMHEPETKLVCCFRELVGGKWLPFFCMQPKLRLKQFEALEALQKARRVKMTEGLHKANLDRGFFERSIRRLSTKPQDEKQLGRILDFHPIGSERGWLHCPIKLLQDLAEGEFRIANPFGDGMEPVLERQFLSLLRDQTGDGELRQWFQQWEDEVRGRQQEAQWERSPESLFGRMEWTIYDFCRFDLRLDDGALLDSCADELCGADADCRLVGIAKELGFSVDGPGRNLLAPVRPGKFEDFKEGRAELQPDLALALFHGHAARNERMAALAEQFPNFLEKLLDLKRLRDSVAHGEGRYPRDMDGAVDFVKTVGRILGYSRTQADGRSSFDPFAAERNIHRWFGVSLCFRMDDKVRQALYRAESFSAGFNSRSDAMPGIRALYAAAQRTIRLVSDGLANPRDNLPGTREQFLSVLEEKITNANAGSIPETFQSVSENRLFSTLHGASGGSLGTETLRLLWKLPEDRLSDLREAMPDYLSELARLSTARGHGNDERTMEPEEFRTKFRKPIYDLIKILMETFLNETA